MTQTYFDIFVMTLLETFRGQLKARLRFQFFVKCIGKTLILTII